MLTPDQIQTLQSTQNTGGSSNMSQPMSSDDFAKWAQPTQAPQEPGMFSRIGSDISTTAQNLGGLLTNTGEHAGETPIRKGAEIAAEATGVIPKVVSELPIIHGVTQAIQGTVGAATGGIVNWLADKIGSTKAAQDFVTNHPDAAKALEEAAGTALGAATTAGNITALQGGAEGVQSAIAKAPEAINAVKGAVQTGKEGVSNAAGVAKEAFVPSYTADEAAGKIAQGKIEDIQPTKEGIQNLSDTSNIKTHQDLVNATNKDITTLSKQVDAEYAKNPARLSVKNFEQTVGEGKSAVRVNYVKQAIEDLKAQYEKTNNAKGSAAIKAFENKAKINGLSYGDINKLARQYGMERSGFNANGELASGLSKQGFENTRLGLKDTARSGLQGDAAKELDGKLSSIYDLRDIAQKNAEAVNKLQQATPKQGVVGKVVNKGIDIAATPLKYGAKKIGIGAEGNAKLNPIELEGGLQKHIQTIRGETQRLPSAAQQIGINNRYNNIKPSI